MELLSEYSAVFRLGLFAGLLVLFAVIERVWPYRRMVGKRVQRWTANLSLLLLGSIMVRLAAPLGAVGAAIWAETNDFGLFNAVELPLFAALVVSIIIMDLAIYLQHLAMHHVPLLWRLHQVHHTDVDLDVTSGVRFHPVELLASVCYKIALAALLGLPAVTVIVFEAIVNAMAMFNHANITIPRPLERYLRFLLVTPDLHRIHHRPCPDETNRNFGSSLIVWDRLFGTYRDQASAPQSSMTLGLNTKPTPTTTPLSHLITMPFRNDRSYKNRSS